MISLDVIDKKILYQLDINSRQSNSQIGRKIGLHKNSISYRINKLIENGVITNFFTIIDAFKLGFMSVRFLLSFQYASQEKRREIISLLEENKSIWYIAEIEGNYDLVVNFWIQDFRKFNIYWEGILEKYRDYIKDYTLSIYTQTHHFIESYLLDENYKMGDREKYEIINSGDKIRIDEIDFSILDILALNARISVVDIARRLNTTSTIVNYRINKLKMKKIIQAFRINIDITKLGLKYYIINIYLKEYVKRNMIINYIKLNSHVKMIDRSIGGPDLIIGFRAKDIKNIHDFILDIDKNFSNIIRNYNYFYSLKINKISFFPSQ